MSEENLGSSIQAAARTRWLDTYRALDVTLPRSPPTSADVAHAREKIDAEIAGIHILLSAVKERRNELASSSMLPPEILALIFTFLVEVAPVGYSYDYSSCGQSSLGWVSTSHVCRRWRSICLGQPSLWTRLPPYQNQWWKAFLARAKEAPLVIRETLYPHRNWTMCLRSILNHQHHIQELSLTDLRFPVLHELVSGLNGSLHRLRVLFLACSSDIQDSVVSLPAGFLADMAPNVQQLSLSGMLFPWGKGGGSSKITEFNYQRGTGSYLQLQANPSFHSHTFSDVVHTLQQMPALKRLKLDNALPDSPAQSHGDKICLPHLEDLSITDYSDSCWYLWSQLRVPLDANIFVRGARTTSLASIIASTLQAHLQVSPDLPFTSISVYIPYSDPGIVRFILSNPSESEQQTSEASTSGHPVQRASITLLISCVKGADLARQLIAGVPLEGIRNVICGGGRPWDSQEFYDIFLPAHSVTDLKLSQTGAGHQLAALTVPPAASLTAHLAPGDDGSPSDGRILFPQLRNLVCDAVNFEERIQLAGSGIDVHDALQRALESRLNDLGMKLDILRITRSDVKEDWVRGWRDIVDEVGWDGAEGALAEPDDDGDGYYGYAPGGSLVGYNYDDDDSDEDGYAPGFF